MNDQGRTFEYSPCEKDVQSTFKRLERAHKALGFALKRLNDDPIRIEMIKHTHPKFRLLKSWYDVILTFLDKIDNDKYQTSKQAFFDDIDKQSDDCFILAIEITNILAPLDKITKS